MLKINLNIKRQIRILKILYTKFKLYWRPMCPYCRRIVLSETIDYHNNVTQKCRKCGYQNEYNDSYP